MSRALATFRDHARRMADSKPDDRVAMDVGGGAVQRVKVGNLTDAERALWRQLAGEASRFLASEVDTDDVGDREPTDDDEPLFAEG